MTKAQIDHKLKNIQSHTIGVQTEPQKESSLKGTLLCVFILGGFIFISWLSAYLLFLSRN